MKNIFKIYALLSLTTAAFLTSCIDEVEPESETATQEQVAASASALESTLKGIPPQMTKGYLVYEGEQVHETDMAYPQFMIMQTELLGDMFAYEPGYDWYNNYARVSGNVGKTTYYSYLPYRTLYMFIKSSNDVIGSVDIETETNENKMGYAGSAYAIRAFSYYLLTVLYEPKENIYTDCSKVLGRTVPIITESTSSEDAKHNPRAMHADMIAFILSDLDKAEKCLTGFTPANKMLPDLNVVYGLKAKVYLWDEDYANAAKYARMAIDNSGATPMTEAQWEEPTTAFSQSNQAWMWYLHYSPENMTNLANYVGHMSSESEWSYAAVSQPMISKLLYDKISNTDFRKHVFIDPQKYDYYNYKTCRDQSFIEDAPDYMALKIRCLDGDHANYSVGGASDVPVMRIEEMYFIEAEAVGMSQGLAAGQTLLNNFMQTYRDPKFSSKAQTQRDLQIEVLTQMRIEFWGEGNAFPSAKRIAPDVIQNFEGTNAMAEVFKVNCKGIRPNWNFVIPESEEESNDSLIGMNNPDPSYCISYPTPIGEFAPANN